MSSKGAEALTKYVFSSKYAQTRPDGKRETWDQAVDRVIDMHRTKYASAIAANSDLALYLDIAHDALLNKRALGSMRNMQYGGTPVLKNHLRSYNCLEKNTRFIARGGVRSFAECYDGQRLEVLTPSGAWRAATVKCYGKQKLNRVMFKRGVAEHVVLATANHRWILESGEVVESIKPGMSLRVAPAILPEFTYDSAEPDEKVAWCYGFVFGDGTRVKGSNGAYTGSMVRLCQAKARFLDRFLEVGFKYSSPPSCKGDHMVYTGSYVKDPIGLDEDPRLVRAFIRGWLDADGAKNNNDAAEDNPFLSLQVTGKEKIEFARRALPLAGAYIVSEREVAEDTNYGPRSDTTVSFRICCALNGGTRAKFRVSSIEEAVVEEDVWCLEVEEEAAFVLDFGLTTGNCSFSYCDRIRFFSDAFYLLLCGTGVGFSVQKHHVAKLPLLVGPNRTVLPRTHVIEDSIEGWAEAARDLISTYFMGGVEVEFDASQVRPKGARISSISGLAPGPEPLLTALDAVRKVLDRCVGHPLRTIDAYDIVMHLSCAVLSGGVRRSATIALFSVDDEDMMNAKTGDWFKTEPQRARSNNSAVLLRGSTDFDTFAKFVDVARDGGGEPGFFWVDDVGEGTNPCGEISFYPVNKDGVSGVHLCNLSTINGAAVKSEADFLSACEAAAVLGTLQAGYTDFPYLGPVTEEIVRGEALLGVSITGIQDRPDLLLSEKVLAAGAEVVRKTNERVAAMIGINPAARLTAIKPEGTTSSLLNTASGKHRRHSRRYIRRVQANATEVCAQVFAAMNPDAVEKSVWGKDDLVLKFPIEAPAGARVRGQETAVEQLAEVALLKRAWIDTGRVVERCNHPSVQNNVSNTVTVRPDEWDAVKEYIYNNRHVFAGVSLLPASGDLDYQQAPFVSIDEPDRLEQRLEWMQLDYALEDVDYTATGGIDRFEETIACGSGKCEF